MKEVPIVTILNIEGGIESIELQWQERRLCQTIDIRDQTAYIYENDLFAFGRQKSALAKEHTVYRLWQEHWSWHQYLQIGQKPRGGLGCHTSTMYGSKVFFLGEQVQIEDKNKTQTFSSFDLATNKWKSLPLEGDHFDRDSAQIQQSGGKIYLVKMPSKEDDKNPLVLKAFDIKKKGMDSNLNKQRGDQSKRPFLFEW